MNEVRAASRKLTTILCITTHSHCTAPCRVCIGIIRRDLSLTQKTKKLKVIDPIRQWWKEESAKQR